MKVHEVNACAFHKWYKIFEDSTIPSIILPLPCNVLNYLQDNGTLVLPEGSYNEVSDPSDAKEEWESDDAVAVAPDLNEFNQKIKKVIKRLGGIAFPKLNWSSPKDASWISFNKSLQCSNPGDVYLLIKSSDFVTHDLMFPYEDCSDKDYVDKKVDYYLILRKWIEINPSDEFRCFVKDRELVGISQRDTSQYYASVHKEKDIIIEDILLFWEERIRNYFPLLSYAFDVHRPKNGHVTLIDFGPFGITTDSLMFSWEELKDLRTRNVLDGVDSNRIEDELEVGEIEPELRYITNATGVQPSPYSRYGLPVDIVDLSTLKLMDFLQMKIQTQGKENSSSDSEDECEEEEEESSLSSQNNSTL